MGVPGAVSDGTDEADRDAGLATGADEHLLEPVGFTELVVQPVPRSSSTGASRPALRRRGVESSEWLSRHRWVVERTFARLLGHRRLGVRDERRADLVRAFLRLACARLPALPAGGPQFRNARQGHR